jgi:PAS domain S-box-containing protein
MTLKKGIYILMAFLGLFLLSLLLTIYVYYLSTRASSLHNRVLFAKKDFLNVLLEEERAVYERKDLKKIGLEYRSFEKNLDVFNENIPDINKRIKQLNNLEKIFARTRDLNVMANIKFLDLTTSVRYIHSHHIAYYKNFQSQPDQTADETGLSQDKSPVKGASEIEIIDKAINIQHDLMDVFSDFYALYYGADHTILQLRFSRHIKHFFASVNTFEKSSLDAQDGILAAEFFTEGRSLAGLFIKLMKFIDQERNILESLNVNRTKILNSMDELEITLKNKSEQLTNYLIVVSLAALFCGVILITFIIVIGYNTIRQIDSLVRGTEMMRDDYSFRIPSKTFIYREFNILSHAINVMASKIQDHVDNLGKKVKERTEKLSVANINLTQEIEQRKEAEAALKKLTRAVEQSPASIVITDSNGIIEYVNPKFCEVTGYSFEEAVGNNLRVLKSVEHSDNRYKEMWETIISGNIWRGELLNKKKNGELYWELASTSPIRNSEGAITHFVAVKEDITERKKAVEDIKAAKKEAESLNEELVKKTELAKEMTEKAKAASKFKSEFLAKMSHEIRTPMNAIIGFSELALDIEQNPTNQDHLNKILFSAKSLLGIINDILDFSKIEAGKLALEACEFNLHELLQRLVDIFSARAEKKASSF